MIVDFKTTTLVRVEFKSKENPDFNGAIVMTWRQYEGLVADDLKQLCQKQYDAWCAARAPQPEPTKEELQGRFREELARVEARKAELEAELSG